MTKKKQTRVSRGRSLQKGMQKEKSNGKTLNLFTQKEKSGSVPPTSNYRKVKYTLIPTDESTNLKLALEVEDITVHSRGSSKGIHYFECASHRHRNDLNCNFRGRIRDFSSLNSDGFIEIIEDHSSTCKFKVGNNTYDYEKNQKLNGNQKTLKTMKIEIEKKLEGENWLTPAEVLDWIKSNCPLNQHLSYSQVSEAVQSWREKNNVYKESYIFKHSLNKAGLEFLRSYFTMNYKKITLIKH